MITLKGYTVLGRLHESSRSQIYQAIRDSDRQPVILKVLDEEYPSPESVAQFKLEYELTQWLEHPGVIQAYAMEKENNTLVIVLEDFGGQSLRRWLNQTPFPLSSFFPLVLQIVAALGAIHQQQIIHKDINPSNIILNLETQQAKIIDFGIATRLSWENPTLRNLNVLEGTLAYISPEQTGRMNRDVDYRTDFYSLGITFYELLTQQLPFISEDPVELVHSHIAKQPLPPHQLNPQIPPLLSQIVMKLLEKTAEDRYQSAFGLQADLQECFQQWQSTGIVAAFPLGQQDYSGRFQIPQKLYGREAEVARLLAAFERSNTVRSAVMLVSGYSGIGKSALVQEIYKPITRQRGYFISGKFDQFQRNIPYSSLIQAFQSLIRQLLTASEAEIAKWREQLLQALHPNGQVIVDVIPEVELIIGPQAPTVELPAQAAQTRFNLVFQNFIGVFTQKEHPLVIFLDDLQWADSASLQLIQLLTGAVNRQALLLIGAYRNNEVDQAHPLRAMIAALEQAGTPIEELTLLPLAIPEIEQLLEDTFKSDRGNSSDRDRIKLLADLLIQKTNGNPFFINEFLKSLYAEKLLYFDGEQRQWQWELEQIQAAKITDNVVELMAGKIQKLSTATQQVLKFAACVGNQFDLKTLSIIREKSLAATAVELWDAVQAGLLLPQSQDYKLLQVTDQDVTTNLKNINVIYKFLHDRVQQAAYSLIPTEQKQSVHLRVGQLLLQSMTAAQKEEKIFDLVNQFNFGVALLATPLERIELAQLNLVAGNKAKSAAAYEPALGYFMSGLYCLNEQSWQEQYALTLDLHSAAAESAYLSGYFDRMNTLVDNVLTHGKTILDQIPVYTVKIQSLIAQEELLAASQLGLQVLKRLDVPLVNNPGQLQTVQALMVTKLALTGKSMTALANAKAIQNPTKLAAIRILASIASATYLAAPSVFPLTVFKQVELSAKYGNAAESAFAYATYGLILCGVVGDLKGGYEFGELSLTLLEKLNAKTLQARTLFVVNTFVRHWRDPLVQTLAPLKVGFQAGQDTGDTEYASFCGQHYCVHLYFIGHALPTVAAQMDIYLEAIQRFKKQPIVALLQIYRQAVANLQGQNEDPRQLIGDFCNASEILPAHIQNNYRTAVFYVYCHSLVLSYLFEDYAKALDYLELARPYLDSVVALYITSLFYFYGSLIRLGLISDASLQERSRLLQQVKGDRKKLATWAAVAPSNYSHKLALVDAELARVQGQTYGAIDLYDRAIRLAQENDYPQETALANELAAKFYVSQGKPKIAQAYMQEARYAYTQWGAIAKVKDLVTRYPQLLTRQLEKSTTTQRATTQAISSTISGSSRSGELDLMSVLKASQALSEEIQLTRLLSNLMQILIENAGAQRGFLLLETDGEFKIQAQKNVSQETVLESVDLASLDTQQNIVLSQAIVNYVIRTKESVVLNDASREGAFIQDPYIVQMQPRSLLCAPLINRGTLAGIIYLENNLTDGAFTADRLEILNVLSSQAAISIENARLYSNLAGLNQNLVSLNQAYERFVPRQFLQLLNKASIVDVELGDQVQREMSVLFTDIRSFTTLSEQMTPAENFRFINSYLLRMEPIILEKNGFIDKYIGDAIMALFAGSADDAVQAGIAMLQALVGFNKRRQRTGDLPIRIGIGINTGSLILGTVGGMNRMDGTVISDAVNLASRIESLTKSFSAPLLITDQTRQRLVDPNRYAMREVGRLTVKGKTQSVTVYEVFDADPPWMREGKLQSLAVFAEALALYKTQQWQAAAIAFQRCLDQNPLDSVAQIYLDRCQSDLQITATFSEEATF